jgi:septal ring factor EnvC (AmiA/AmiB activator)
VQVPVPVPVPVPSPVAPWPALRLASVLLLLALLVSGRLPARAVEPGDATPAPAEVERLERDVRRLRSLAARYQSAERSLLGGLQALDQELALRDRELELQAARDAGTEAEIGALEARLADLEQRVEEQRLGLRRSLAAAYSSRRPDWLALLVAAGSAEQLPRNLHMLSRLSQRQSAEVERYAAERRAVAHARAELDEHQARLERLRRGAEQQRLEMLRSRERKRAFLADLERRRDQTETELTQAASELGRFVGDLGLGPEPAPSTDFAARRGRLPWPLEAPVLKPFGVERHPRFGTLIEHPGVDLAARPGTPVRAIHAGRVAFADWFKGYGLLAIVDHGTGYYSLYAHLRDLAVAPGAVVGAGGVLGHSGETGSLEGPRLYLEIRHRDRPLDPGRWLARRGR